MNFTKYLFNGSASGVSVVIKGIESAKEYWESQEKEEKKVLFLVPDLTTLKAMVDQEIIKEEIQVGGLGGGPNRKNVLKISIYLKKMLQF